MERMTKLKRFVFCIEQAKGGIKRLPILPNLEYLEIQSVPIGDAELESLKGCKKLAVVKLWRTNVTKKGTDYLQRSFPNCEIDDVE